MVSIYEHNLFSNVNTVHINFTYPTAIIYYHKNVSEQHILIHLATITIKSIFIFTHTDTHMHKYIKSNNHPFTSTCSEEKGALSFLIIYYIQGYFPEKETFFQTQTFVIRPR